MFAPKKKILNISLQCCSPLLLYLLIADFKKVLKMANVRTARRHLTMLKSLKESSKIEETYRVPTHMYILKYLFNGAASKRLLAEWKKIFFESVTTPLFFISLFFPIFSSTVHLKTISNNCKGLHFWWKLYMLREYVLAASTSRWRLKIVFGDV